MIKTERLMIIPITLDDIDDMYEYAKNPIIGKMAGWKAHQDKEHTKSVIELLMKLGHIYSIIYDNKMIGTVGLTFKDKVNIGYVLNQDYWHKGIMHEALKGVIIYLFTKTDHQIIEAETYVDNYPSQQVLLKLGFKFIGTTDMLKDDKYVSINKYELTKQAYERNELPWQNTTINK